MKRIALANRILSLGLAVALAASSPMSVYAGEETDAPVEASVQISEGAASSDVTSSDGSNSSESGQPESGDALIDASQATDTQTDGNGVVNTIADEIKNDIANEGTPAAETPVVDADEKASDDEAGETPAEDGEEVTDEDTKPEDAEPEDAEPTSEEEDAEKCEHVFGEWTSNEDGTHSRTCSECGEVETDTCDYDEDGVCKICGYKKAEEDPEIEYTYISNGDGTHTKKWVTIDEEGNEVPHEETEECEFDENGICIHCGQEKVEEKEDQEFEVTVGEYTIKVTVPAGAFDFDVTFEAEETTLTETEEQLVEETVEEDQYATSVVFDLRFMHDGEEVEPNEGYNISVSIESPNVQADDIVHIKDENEAEIISVDDNNGVVDFELDSFSKAALVHYNIWNESQILYDDLAYGSAYTNQSWSYKESYKKNTHRVSWGSRYRDIDVTDYHPIQVQYEYADNKTTVIAPDKNNKDTCFLYSNMYVDMNFVAPENYYIEKVTLLRNGTTYGNSEFVPGAYGVTTEYYNSNNTYAKKISFNTWLVTQGNSNHCNVFKVSLKKMTTTLTNTTTVVNGATLVNYVDKTTSFGNDFKFLTETNNVSPASNAVHYGQVYQGLANTSLSNGVFNTTNGNTTLFFPSSEQYNSSEYSSYIDSCYNNVGVVFTKDSDGYWTIDSSQRGYRYNSSNNKLEAVNSVDKESDGATAFRPFGTGSKEKDHYGMYLPISFAVNDSCTTNGEDTVFRFSGDDDVFVYIDDKLVLDLGGIHNTIDGQINFKTGEILIQGYSQNGDALTSSTDSTVFYGNGRTNEGKNLYGSNGILGVSQSQFTQNKNHTLKVVYFERGGHRSNCKISFNFAKNETRNVEYKGLKVQEDGVTPLADATFTLYTDEGCTNVAKTGTGANAVAVSDSEGTIKFEGISAGVISDGSTSVTKTYYMKETNAPDGYEKQDGAVWKLVLTANLDDTSSSVLTALNDDAKKISLDDEGKTVAGTDTSVKAIKNLTPGRTLEVTKVVSDGTNVNPDPNAEYVFVIEKVYVEDGLEITEPVANESYKIGDEEFVTNENGEFKLKAAEMAVFSDLHGEKFVVTEKDVSNSEHDYTLKNYDTRIIVDNDYTNITRYDNDTDLNREIVINYVSQGENGTQTVATEKAVKFENLFTNTTDNTIESVLSKYIVKNDVDDYDLTLTFKGPTYWSQTTNTTAADNTDKAKIDVVVVFDLSYSMIQNNSTRLASAKTAVANMVDSVDTDAVDAQWKLVSFASYASVNTSNWVDGQTLVNTVNNLEVTSNGQDGLGGTNYQDALVEAKNALNSGSREGAKKVVVFVTDGQPTFHLCEKHTWSYGWISTGWYSGYNGWRYDCNDGGKYSGNCTHTDHLNNSGYPCKGGGDKTYTTDYNGALMGARALSCDYFYAVGIELDDGDVYDNMSGLGVLTKVAEATDSSTHMAYNSTESNLSSILSDIGGSFGTIYGSETGEKTYSYASSAVITDELSEYVDIVEGSEFSITVKDSEGNDVSGTSTPGKIGESNATYVLAKDGKNYTFTAKYSDAGYGKVTLDLDSTSDYTLSDYTYSVTFKVKPSAEAYSYMAEHESYPFVDGDATKGVTKGQEGTGSTSEDKEGFYSNNSAYVTYKFRNGDCQEFYKKPVVQVEEVSDWNIKKTDTAGNPLAGAKFVLTVPGVTGSQKTYYGISDSNGILMWYGSDSDRTYAVNPVVIPNGTYSLKETEAPVGYAKSDEVWTVVIDGKNGISAKTSDGADITVDVSDGQALGNGVTKKVYTISFVNEVAYTLPETGGRGIYVYTIGGVLLMLGASLMLYKNKKNQKNIK